VSVFTLLGLLFCVGNRSLVGVNKPKPLSSPRGYSNIALLDKRGKKVTRILSSFFSCFGLCTYKKLGEVPLWFYMPPSQNIPLTNQKGR
jgi:hypothetical protein